jgi:hypothetical protein
MDEPGWITARHHESDKIVRSAHVSKAPNTPGPGGPGRALNATATRRSAPAVTTTTARRGTPQGLCRPAPLKKAVHLHSQRSMPRMRLDAPCAYVAIRLAALTA